MPDKAYKMVRASEYFDIPVPLGLTPEQEAELVTKYNAEHSLEEQKAEYDLFKGMLDGTIETRSVEEVLQALDGAQQGHEGTA